MNDEVEWLRKAFAEVQPEDSQDFDPEELWDAAQGKADSETRLKWIDRMSYDPEAVEIWRMAKQLQDELPTEDPEVGTVAPSVSERDVPDNVVSLFPRAALWAAPVLLMAALGLLVALPAMQVDSSAPVYRDGAEVGIEAVSAPTELAGPGPYVLRWQGVPADALVEVQVYDAALKPLTSGAGKGLTQLELSADALSGVAPGSSVVWRVRATTPDGERLESAAYSATWRGVE